jgi:hypothetical protein
VGNIVADAQGGKITLSTGWPDCTTPSGFWQPLFCTDEGRQSRRGGIFYSDEEFMKLSYELSCLTGYSENEMAQIEYAFETNTSIFFSNYIESDNQSILEDQYRGLCAVVDVMLKLDGIEPDPKYAAKFREHKSLQPT